MSNCVHGLVLVFLLAHCGGANEPSTTPQVAEDDTFGIRNAARPFPRILTAGQPTPAQLDAAHQAGVRTVISLRAEDEPGQEWEAETLEGEGVRFVRIPIRGAEDLTEDRARQLDAALAAALAEEADVLVHCGSSNRVGALMALRAFYVEGKSVEEALAVGRAAGLTRLEPVVRAHLQAACESRDRC